MRRSRGSPLRLRSSAVAPSRPPIPPVPPSLPICRSLRPRSSLGEDGSLGVCQRSDHRMRTDRLLSQIINACIHATVPRHNRWPVSTRRLFMRLSPPSVVPKARQERWRNYFIARGPEELSSVRNPPSGSNRGVTRGESLSTEAGEVKLFRDCSFMLLDSETC